MTLDFKLLIMIFVINVTYVSLNTIRFMLTMKGYRYIAPIISMIEITIYILGLSMVLDRLDNPINLFVYALGYGVGIAFGIFIEEKLALGYIMVTVIIQHRNTNDTIVNTIRDHGYGVTVSYAEGLTGERMMLEILSSRKSEKELYRLIKELDTSAFVISYEPKYISGGFWTKRVKNR